MIDRTTFGYLTFQGSVSFNFFVFFIIFITPQTHAVVDIHIGLIIWVTYRIRFKKLQ